MHSAVAVLLCIALWTPPASAEESQPVEAFAPALTTSYLWDGGAIPFVYGSLAVALGARVLIHPPDEPRFFSQQEGGATPKSNTVPSSVVGIYSFGTSLSIALLPSPAKLYHFKGYAEAVLTAMALTEVVKNSFGRRRPDFVEGDTRDDQRRSFFSGHSSINTASILYMGLYFHKHLSPQLSGPSAPYYRTLAYAGMGALLIGIPASRVVDNRHHISDVTAGVAVGGAIATAFFLYQESRYEKDSAKFRESKQQSRFVVLPDIKNRGISIMTTW